MSLIGRTTFVIVLSGILSACTSTTGTRVQLTPESLREIQTLGIVIGTNESFSVHNAREKMDNTTAVIGAAGGALGVIIATSIEGGVRASNDSDAAKRLQPALGDFDVRTELAGHLSRHLTESGLFKEVRLLDSNERRAARQARIDAILDIDIQQWGLVVCDKSSGSTRMQAILAVREELVALGSGRTLWSRSDMHLDGECYAAAEYVSRDNLLRDVLKRSAAETATRIANEIRYPRAAAVGGSQ
jgi:hypothetical protein